MEKLITSCRSNFQSVPENYIFPPESRPGNVKVPFSSSIPVIDLSEARKGDRTNIIQKIIKAAEEFGFFQVHIAHPIFYSLVFNNSCCWLRAKLIFLIM
jgi:hypothetical protein